MKNFRITLPMFERILKKLKLFQFSCSFNKFGLARDFYLCRFRNSYKSANGFHIAKLKKGEL